MPGPQAFPGVMKIVHNATTITNTVAGMAINAKNLAIMSVTSSSSLILRNIPLFMLCLLSNANEKLIGFIYRPIFCPVYLSALFQVSPVEVWIVFAP